MTDLAVLRMPVGGEWSVGEWTEFLATLNSTYSCLALLDVVEQLSKKQQEIPEYSEETLIRINKLLKITTITASASEVFLITDEFFLEHRLYVAVPPKMTMLALQYGSEGVSDLLGHGGAIEAICESFNNILKAFTERKARKINNALMQLELIEKRVESYKKTGADDESVAQYREALLAQSDRVLSKLIRDGKLKKNAVVLPPPPEYRKLPPPAAS